MTQKNFLPTASSLLFSSLAGFSLGSSSGVELNNKRASEASFTEEALFPEEFKKLSNRPKRKNKLLFITYETLTSCVKKFISHFQI